MIFIDSETTGLTKPYASELSFQPYMTEIFCCKVDSNFDNATYFDSLIKPPIPIPDDVIEITHITNEMVADAPKFIEIYDDLCNYFLGETIIIGHNLSFDRDILKFELMRYDLEFKFPWPKTHICTVEKSYQIKNKRLKLSQLHEMATGKPEITGAHRAREDVMALIRSFIWLKEQGYVEID